MKTSISIDTYCPVCHQGVYADAQMVKLVRGMDGEVYMKAYHATCPQCGRRICFDGIFIPCNECKEQGRKRK